MNAKVVEDLLEKRLKRLLGRKITVTKGPLVITKLSGIHPEVAVHVSHIKDHDGIMPDGAHTKRRIARGPTTFKGFEEERPATIILSIDCIAGTYKLVQEICDVLTPGVLLALEMLPRFSLGSLPDESVELHFEDFISSFSSSSINLEKHEDFSFYRGELVFFMNGFIHVWLTKRGGFSNSRYNKSKPKPNVSPMPPKRQTTKTKRRAVRKKKSGKP
jgi:hypothetical protein